MESAAIQDFARESCLFPPKRQGLAKPLSMPELGVSATLSAPLVQTIATKRAVDDGHVRLLGIVPPEFDADSNDTLGMYAQDGSLIAVTQPRQKPTLRPGQEFEFTVPNFPVILDVRVPLAWEPGTKLEYTLKSGAVILIDPPDDCKPGDDVELSVPLLVVRDERGPIVLEVIKADEPAQPPPPPPPPPSNVTVINPPAMNTLDTEALAKAIHAGVEAAVIAAVQASTAAALEAMESADRAARQRHSELKDSLTELVARVDALERRTTHIQTQSTEILDAVHSGADRDSLKQSLTNHTSSITDALQGETMSIRREMSDFESRVIALNEKSARRHEESEVKELDRQAALETSVNVAADRSRDAIIGATRGMLDELRESMPRTQATSSQYQVQLPQPPPPPPLLYLRERHTQTESIKINNTMAAEVEIFSE